MAKSSVPDMNSNWLTRNCSSQLGVVATITTKMMMRKMRYSPAKYLQSRVPLVPSLKQPWKMLSRRVNLTPGTHSLGQQSLRQFCSNFKG